MSREDLKFMDTVEGSFIQCEEGHIKFVCPFVIKVWCCLLTDAKRRAELSPKFKFPKNARFQEDYSTSLENVIQEGFAEKVLSEDLYRADNKI